MARHRALLLMLLLTLSPVGPAWSEGPLLGRVVSVNAAEGTLVLRVDADSELRELTLGLGESGGEDWLRADQLVRIRMTEKAVEGAAPVVRSIMAVGGTGRDPTGVRARIGRDAAGRPPGGGRHGR